MTMTMILTIIICIIEVKSTVVIVRGYAWRHECLRNLGPLTGTQRTCFN